MSKKNEISKFYIFNIFLIFVLINPIKTGILVKADGNINFTCEKDILYISIDVTFTKKPKKLYNPFTLTLVSPENFQLKCMLDYFKSKISCFHSFSYDEDYIEEGDLFKFPISFPQIEEITWDYKTFINEVFRRIYNSKFDCGGGEKETLNYYKNDKIWDIEGSIIKMKEDKCLSASLTGYENHRYFFDLGVAFTSGDIINNLKNDIYLLQDIWIPLITEEIDDDEQIPFAFCSSKEKINKENISNFLLKCYIPINLNTIFNDVINIKPFFDKVYIQNDKEIKLIDINFKVQQNEDTLSFQDKEIICPLNPVFTIEDKADIMMGEYNTSNQYSFYIIGTLSNGYYQFKNGTIVELAQTYKDIKFNLIIQDNFINSEENDVKVGCVLPEGTPYDEEQEAIIKCTGKRSDKYNIDLVLNWNLKENNNIKELIIKWPPTHDNKRKNLYGYDLRGISIKQKDCICHNNFFNFYVYIYDLGREPKLNFEMPLKSPKDTFAQCKLFDRTALKCSLDLRHKKLSKGTKIMLPEKGINNIIETSEGNVVKFLTDNLTEINNEKDILVQLKESCGDYMVVGTLKDMGMSHKTSVVTYVLIIVFIFLFVFGIIAYMIYKCKLMYDRGDKLTASEETKNSTKVGNVTK